MKQQNVNVLNLAEYVSLAAAVVGSAASVASQQMVYASAPLSLSLVLSLLNRRRETHELSQSSEAELKQLRDELFQVNLYLGNLEALRQKLLALPSPPEDINLATVPEGWVQTVQAEVQSYDSLTDEALSDQSSPSSASVDALLDGLSPDRVPTPFPHALVQPTVLPDNTQISELQAGVDQLQENLSHLQTSLNEQSQQVLTQLQHQINEELEALRHLMDKAPVSPTAATDLEALRQETLTRLSEGVADILLEVKQSLAPLAGLDGAALNESLAQCIYDAG